MASFTPAQGGLSGTFHSVSLAGFAPFFPMDKRMITHKDWDIISVDNAKEIVEKGLIPILSTSYGLAISVKNDNITQKPFKDIVDYLIQVDKDRQRDIEERDNGINLLYDWDTIK